MGQKFNSLEAFKDAMKDNCFLDEEITPDSDVMNFDLGMATIHRKNLNGYLEKYMCKNEKDLSDTLWLNYGIFVKYV